MELYVYGVKQYLNTEGSLDIVRDCDACFGHE